MNIDRPCTDGIARAEEVLNKSQIYVTTAGYKGTFAYDKLIQLLMRMIIDPDKAIIMGGTYRIPVLVGLQSKDFVEELRADGTFNDATFAREYESEWSGTVEGSFFNGEMFDRCRKLLLPEDLYSSKSSKDGYYVISCDVGRRLCLTAITVIKVSPQLSGASLKSIVNMYIMEDEHFEDQAIKLKLLYFQFKARVIVIDGNGLIIAHVKLF